MSIFNFDNNKNNKNKIITPLQRLGIEFYYKERQTRELCQMCGNEIPSTAAGGDYLQQLWIEDLPLAMVCTDCVAMIQRLVIEVRKQRLEIKKISNSNNNEWKI